MDLSGIVLDRIESKLTESFNKIADIRPDVELQDHQRLIVNQALKEQVMKKVLMHTLGSGKTLSAIASAEALGKPYTAVVPASLRENFRKEIEKFTESPGLERVVSYEQFMKDPEGLSSPTMIFDEAHRMRNPSSARARAGLNAAMSAENAILLSGSPIVNSPSDLVPLMNMVGDPTTMRTFEESWLKDSYSRAELAAARESEEARKSLIPNRDKFLQAVSGKIDVFSKVPESAELTEETINVPFSEEQSRTYIRAMRTLPSGLREKLRHDAELSEKDEKRLLAFMSGPRQIGLSLTPYSRYKSPDPLEMAYRSPKLMDAAKRVSDALAKDPESKAAIFSNFIGSGIEPMRALLDSKNIPTEVFHGGMNDKERREAVENYNTGKSRVFLFGPAGGEGISLKGTRLLQLLDPHWNETRLNQAIGRGLRFDSHEHLPEENRKLKIEKFISTMPQRGPLGELWNTVISMGRNPKKTPDQILSEIAYKKQLINQAFEEAISEASRSDQASR